MTTQIVIDETLLNQAVKAAHAQSGREAVEIALRLLIQHRASVSGFLRQSPLTHLRTVTGKFRV